MANQQGFRRLAEVQQQLAVSRWTLYKWLRHGKMRGIKLHSGHYRIPEAEINRLAGQVVGDGQRNGKGDNP
jgi:excisionase family DNA binding protein